MAKPQDYISQLEIFFEGHFLRRETDLPKVTEHLLESVKYSLFGGGKRFRPQLVGLTSEALGCSFEKTIPFAAAVEFIHTYSLVHDDLPCMDDDKIRRGHPTNHIRFGEATALLAGDALLTEAFYILAKYYSGIPDIGLTLTRMLSQASGLTGMVAGQIMDIEGEKLADLPREQLLKMHELKTGALIRTSVEGAGLIAGANKKQADALKEFGACVGMAFQLADDILDYDPKNLENSGFPKLLGIEETKKLLSDYSQRAKDSLNEFGASTTGFIHIIDHNLSRTK